VYKHLPVASDRDSKCLTSRPTCVVLPHLSTPSRRIKAPLFGLVALLGVIIAINTVPRSCQKIKKIKMVLTTWYPIRSNHTNFVMLRTSNTWNIEPAAALSPPQVPPEGPRRASPRSGLVYKSL